MSRAARLGLVLSVLVLGALASFVAQRFRLTTDITSLLPHDADKETLRLVREVSDSELGRTMVLTVGSADPSEVLAATRELERRLRTDPDAQARIASLEGGPAEGAEQAIYTLYHPRRFAFFAASGVEARGQLDDTHLTEAAVRLRDALGASMSPLIGRVAPSDPLQILPRLFDRLAREQGGNLRVEDGRFITRDGRFGVLFLRSHAAGFDSAAQSPLLAALGRAFSAVSSSYGGRLTLDTSGVARFAVRAEQTIRHDLEQVSTLSSVGLFGLLLLIFRSPRLLLLASIPLAAGTLCGLAACLAVYGRVHGITLAFGASLLGVALDYVEHLYCHHAVAPHPDGPGGTLRAIGPSLVTGAVTTLVGFLALGGSGFRGLEEVALFSSVGLVGALVSTFTMLPALLPRSVRPVAFRERVVRALGRVFARLSEARPRLWLLPAGALLVAAVGLPRLTLSRDTTMGQLDASLVAEDERVRARVARYEQMRFVLAVGADEEEALQHNDALYAALERERLAGQLGSYRNVGAFLPSARAQREVDGAVRGALGDGQHLTRLFAAAADFRPEAFGPFLAALATPQPAPLRYDDLARSQLAGLVRSFRVPLREGIAFITFLERVKDPLAFGERMAALPGVRFVDQQEELARGHALYQDRTLKLVLLGVVGVFVLLLARYRKLAPTIAAFAPAALAAAVTLAVLGLWGRPLDLVGMSALLMVVSMGVDYGVFLVDARHSEDERRIALLSVFMAASTTVLGFGTLALSRHPMLSMIGVTATVGMLASLVLAPTTLVLVGHGPAPEKQP